MVLEVNGLTPENSQDICTSVAIALAASVSYCDLVPKPTRRVLQDAKDAKDLFMEVSREGTGALTEARDPQFISHLENLPDNVTVSDIEINLSTTLHSKIDSQK